MSTSANPLVSQPVPTPPPAASSVPPNVTLEPVQSAPAPVPAGVTLEPIPPKPTAEPSLWQKTKSAISSWADKQDATEREIEREATRQKSQLAGEKEYSDYLYRTAPEEYKQANPSDYYLRKLHDLASEALTEPVLRGMHPDVRKVVEPSVRQLADAGLSLYGLPSGGQGVGRTEDVKQGVILPEGGAEEEALEASGRKYVYHATTADRAADIAEEGLQTHKPWEHTDQSEWPDRTTEKRAYFATSPEKALPFTPEGKPVMLRMERDPKIHKVESTGDIYTRKKVPPEKLEIQNPDGSWRPIKPNPETVRLPAGVTLEKIPQAAPTFTDAYTKEGAQSLADHLNSKSPDADISVVGSVAQKGKSAHDLDLRINGTHEPQQLEASMKEAGFQPIGSSIVTPEEVQKSGKDFGGPGWKRAYHFESIEGPRQKIDVWKDAGDEPVEGLPKGVTLEPIPQSGQAPNDFIYHGTSPSGAEEIRKTGVINAGDFTSDIARARNYASNNWNPNAEPGTVFVVKQSDAPGLSARGKSVPIVGELNEAGELIPHTPAAKEKDFALPAPTGPASEADRARMRALNLKHVGIPIEEMNPEDAKNWLGYSGQKTIKVYRGTQGGEVAQPGDFVTTSRENAQGYGPKVTEMEVPASDLRYVRGHQHGDPARVDEGGQTELLYAPKANPANMPRIAHGNADEFQEAVTNTPGAKMDGKKLTIDAVRYQKPEQAGEQAVRTGVFYLPEKNSPYSRYYKTGRIGYGGEQKIEGQLTLNNPIVAKGASGGKVPERAYDAVKGAGAYQEMRDDVVRHSINLYPNKSEQALVDKVAETLQKYGANPDMARNIVEHSKEGNTLAYAIQENIVAHALRDAGYDGIVGYSKIRGGHRLSEVFDINKKTYPMGIKGLLGLTVLVSGAAQQAEQENESSAVKGIPPGVVLTPIQ
jgi:hypothetical protein